MDVSATGPRAEVRRPMKEDASQDPSSSGNHVTPEELLASLPITRELKRLGVTDEQLRTLHFASSGRGYPFDEWPVLGSDVPTDAIPLLKRYCTLKWLLLEDPPPSRDRDDAWQYITMLESAHLVEAGLNAKKAQQTRARKPRVKLYDGTTINEIIADLALSPEHRDQTAEELWPHFYARLEALGHSPEEILHPSEPRKCAYRYGFAEKQRKISRGRFANVVATARKAAQSR
jgi:hypothetical protein